MPTSDGRRTRARSSSGRSEAWVRYSGEQSDTVDLVTVLEEVFGVHPKTGDALLRYGKVTLDGETVGARYRQLPLRICRGKMLAVTGTNCETRPWGMPAADPVVHADWCPMEQLEFA